MRLTSFYAFVFTFSSCLWACEDEVVDRIVEIPGDTVIVSGLNQVNAFLVTEISPDTVLEAAIVEDSLVIYWPSYEPIPGSISPQIFISEGASINPASGTPVPFATGTKYIVTAESGDTRNYVLKVVINQPAPVYSTNVSKLSLSGTDGFLAFNGDFFIPDTSQTQVYFISWEDDQQIQLEIDFARIKTTQIVVTIPANLPKGYYRTKMRSGTHTINKEDSVWIKYPQPLLSWPAGLSVRQGETFEIPGTNIRDITEIQLSTITQIPPFPPSIGDADQQRHTPFEIVSTSLDAITLRVPQDFPVGSYNGFEITYLSTKWAESIAGVTEKDGEFFVLFGTMITVNP